MSDSNVYTCFDISQEDHRKLKLYAIEKGCSLRSLIQDAVHRYAVHISGPEKMSGQKKDHLRAICDTVFYLSRYAESLEIDRAITVPDERELSFHIFDWAREFVEKFDPNGRDPQMELESCGRQWLMKTFPYVPEKSVRRQAICDFICFEDETSVIWPWALSADELLQNENILNEIEQAVCFNQADEYDTDELYEAINRIAGVHPTLVESNQKMTDGNEGGELRMS